VSKAESSRTYQRVLNYGVKECLKKLKNDNFISTSDFQVSKVTKVLRQQNSKHENYKFNVEMVNNAGIQLETKFEVQSKQSSQQLSLLSYSAEGLSPIKLDEVMVADYQNEDEEQLLMGNYERVADEEVHSNKEIKEAVDYGVEETVKKVTKREKYESKDFQVKNIKRVYREAVHKQKYRVETTLQNSSGTTMESSFLVNYSKSTGSKQLENYSYSTY
jgi:hypothetical protein